VSVALSRGLLALLILMGGAVTDAQERRVQDSQPPSHYIVFDGLKSYVEVPATPDLSVSPTGLSVAIWMRPDTLTFPRTEGSRPDQQYVHWLGKGERGHQEWTFRMYSRGDPAGPRDNRISFYVFNAAGGRGCGSYFQDPITPREWIHVVGVLDQAMRRTTIYKNGALRHSDSYATIAPVAGPAPLRIGTKDFASFFKGAIGSVTIWARPLSPDEIRALYATDAVPPAGLVARYEFGDTTPGVLLKDVVRSGGRGPISNRTGQSGGGC